MYAIVMKVVKPARISVRQSAPSVSNSKYRSRRWRIALVCHRPGAKLFRGDAPHHGTTNLGFLNPR